MAIANVTQARVDAAAMLAAFERTHEVLGSPADVVLGIQEFKCRLGQGEVRVDREDFAANLRGILPRPEGARRRRHDAPDHRRGSDGSA